ncbi:hypothetical protein DPSP01_000335 [Paraphaeosphaeria sporulosa]|uniref:C2H2-type domain-containing protein n=1 Tax=Paraphaeosphaeria sporulosa TaxID=1460663 RepID=A0A177D003_9PLEO|nr:uncharacterized protein CC84DRAFT_1135659 [Paraphaeosphaeria sporulosa]OAG12731.1 hypothetical protein CC84DRAFT_1135659 [Paraphaeosphaeria sporulosa]
MASNNYDPYNYSYQQIPAQQYSGNQTAPVTNNVPQSSRQYKSTPATSQASDYMSYQAQSYNDQGCGYGGAQDNNWGGSSYGGNRETTSRAAEVLRNMSNTAYTPSNATPASQAAFTGTIAPTYRYSSNFPQGHSHQLSRTHAVSSTIGQSQARPRSVNANRGCTTTPRGLSSPALAAGYPSQRASTAFNQQPQRSASPAQHPATSARGPTISTASQYNNCSNRQFPSINATRSGTAAASSYNYGDTHAPTSTFQSPANNAADSYNQGAITVDPMAVYDPWPEYQRKQEAVRAQKAVEDAARGEAERIAEEARKDERRKKEEEERRQQEEEERSRQAKQSKPEQKSHKSQQPAEAGSGTSAGGAEEGPTSADMEDEIRALMAKMREFNSKDPVMLARIWEEERRAKAPKSPLAPARTVPPATPVPHPAQTSAPQVANQRKKVSAARESSAAAVATPAIPIAMQHAARLPVPAATASTRAGGHTIWPSEKKTTLASAAAAYLNGQNPQMPVYADQILDVLDGNPSYVALCEHLENMGIKLDRAAFARSLLAAVPDINSKSQGKTAHVPNSGAVAPCVPVAPTAVTEQDIGSPATPITHYPSAAPSPAYPAFPDSHTPTAPKSAPVAEMVPTNPELKRPANKEEAARKRDFSDLIDLTQADEDEIEPLPKRTHVAAMSSFTPFGHTPPDYMYLDEGFHLRPSAHNSLQPAIHQPVPPASHALDLRHAAIVEPLDRKKALRRNTYNIKTIARDVLLACGRHPEQRQLNQHLEVLRATLPQIQQDADLSTLRWDLIDPGKPPRGYFRDGTQRFAEDADDEDDSHAEGDHKRRGLFLQSSESTNHQKVQAPPLAEAVNPFKQKRRIGRPPRNSFGPDQTTKPSTPARPAPKMSSASAPRAGSAGVGYSAFRSATQYDANGNPMPKKRGRPVGWRKNIHGSAQAQAHTSANGSSCPRQPQFKPAEPSGLRNSTLRDNGTEPIRIDSRSSSAPNKTNRYQSFKCKWQGCKAELHNLDTLKKHVSKVHRNSINTSGFIECHWADCASEVTNQDAMTGMRFEQHKTKSFTTIANWMQHLEQLHFSPLSWELGDGPAGGVSDAADSEAYLSDAHGLRVTPKLTPRPEYLESSRINTPDRCGAPEPSAPRGRGRPPKHDVQQEVMAVQKRLVAQKKRIGGPGMDRGGATLVNEKRRKGFVENDDDEEELVDAEDEMRRE